MENKPVNIFWTGGWDSTFRVMQLLIEEKRKVQPHFVVRGQASVGKEITTMIDIRRELFRNYPVTRDLLLPTEYIDVRNIIEKQEITNAVNYIKKRQEFAQQYDFCSRYCFQNDIDDMEMCIHKDDKAHKLLAPYLENSTWKINGEKTEKGQKAYDVFQYYRFPLFSMTKLDMKKIAKSCGWLDLLEMTWFCASPYKGKPCGFCGPCTYVIDEGLSRRLPIYRRIISKIHMPARRIYRNRIKYNRTNFEQATGL